MSLCEYKLYDPASKGMTPCGCEGIRLEIPEKARKQGKSGGLYGATLCPTHIAFVRDALMPIEVEYGKALRELALDSKRVKAAKRKSPSPKVCPHCGHVL